jgi:glycogen debranching enzyme
MTQNTISILDGSTFIVSDRLGNIDASPNQPHGLFFRDTRHLSRWVLTVDGTLPDTLSADDLEYNHAQFFLIPKTGTIYKNPYVSLVRRRHAGDGFSETLMLFNHGTEPVELELRLEAACDFADLFEVKDALAKKGRSYREVRKDMLVLGYQREQFVRETHIRSREAAEVTDGGFVFRPRVEAKAEWKATLLVAPMLDHQAIEPKYAGGKDEPARPNMGESLAQWLARMPRMESMPPVIQRTCLKSAVDLAALRFYPFPDTMPEASVPAAGLPWFMALFGRDSLMTSYQMLPFAPDLAATTLRVLAARQGKEIDDFREEQPGRILHEMRYGELTVFHERPHSPYYGASDTTPLFLILLDEYERWTGDAALTRELQGAAEAALAWIDRFGDRDGDGYIEYERTRETGLENQCWKDSWNSIVHPDGTLASMPRATCELQGYVYDAKRRVARLAREVWGKADLAVRLEQEAADLKQRFNRDYWIPDRKFFALALDGQKRKVETLASNIGHLLWSGIVDDDKIEPIVRHLMGPQLYSGWGVRTLAAGQGAYNPIEYHNGTVWPHDNSFIAAGLARAGYRAEASLICQALFEAALFFDLRLPEVFAGYARERTAFPVEYPTASSPQAWASGAPLLAVRVMLGLEPKGDVLTSDPILPEYVGRLALRGIPGRWGRADVDTGLVGGPDRAGIVADWLGKLLVSREASRAA